MRWSLALLFSFWSPLPWAGAENLLRNGSFEGGTKYWLEKFEIVTDNVRHGRKAARTEKYLRSSPLAVEVGKPITIAFWGRSDTPGPIPVMFSPTDRHRMREGGKPGFQAFYGKPAGTVSLTHQWERYVLEVTIPKNVGDADFNDPNRRTFFLVLGKNPKARAAYYDGVTVAYEGQGKNDYIPEGLVEVVVQATNLPGYDPHANIYPADAPVNLTLSIFNPAKEPRKALLRWELLDYAGSRQLLPSTENPLELPAGKSVQVDHTLKLAGRGLQLARATVLDGDGKLLGQSDQPLTCLAFPRAATKFDPAERFGGTLVAGQPKESHMITVAQHIGLAWSRWLPQMNWSAIQPIGPDAWTWPDATLDALAKHGIGHNIVMYSLPKWAHGKHHLLPRDMESWGPEDPRWEDLTVVTSWDRFVTTMVKRYGDRNYVWEIVNEPELDHWDPAIYLKFFARTQRLIKGINPQLKVMHNSVNGMDRITRQFLAGGGANLCDIFSFHNYTHGGYMDGQGIRMMRNAFRAAGRKGPDVEIWMNEGWAHFPSSEDYRAATRIGDRTPAWVADMTVRCVADTFAAGMEKLIVFNMAYPKHGSSWWDWAGDGTAWYDNLDQPTVAVGVFNVLAEQLGRSRPVRTMQPEGAVLHVFHDERHDRGVILAWATEKPITLSLPVEGLMVLDVMGNPLGQGQEKNQLSLAVPQRPVYIYNGESGVKLVKALESLEPKGPSLADRTLTLPKPWYNNGAFPNPYMLEGKPLWEMGRVWPAQPDKIDSYGPLPKWDASNSKWIEPANVFGGNPAGVVTPEGQVRITAVGPRKGGDARAGTLSFTVPADGVYDVSARVKTSRWEGTGELKFVILKLDRKAGTLEKVGGYVLTDRKPQEVSIENLALKAGQQLVFRFTIDAFFTQSGCTFEIVRISRR